MTNSGRIFLSTACVAAAIALAPPAHAAKTDWLSPAQTSKFVKTLMGGKGVLTGIECRDSGKPGGGYNDMALVRVSYSANPSKTGWSWAIGEKSWFEKTSAQKASQGYKRVSYGRFVRKLSGVLVQCAVWNR